MATSAYLHSKFTPKWQLTLRSTNKAEEIRQVSESASMGSLSMLELEVSVQEDPAEYLNIITRSIPKEKILRWYISRIDEEYKKASIEVVVIR